MNDKPIEHARDADIRLSLVALQRAAQRAREIAEKTGTAIVISRDGVIEYLRPVPTDAGSNLQERSTPYGKE